MRSLADLINPQALDTEEPPPAYGSLLSLLASQPANSQPMSGGPQGGPGGGPGKGGWPNLSISDWELLHGPGVPGHTGHLHFAADKGIVKLGKRLQSLGFDVGEHPKFGGVAPVHTEGSHHYNRDAIDVNYRGGGRWGNEAQALAWLKRKLSKLYAP
jgi:hypothetical protein